MWQAILQQGMWHGELINRRKDGSLYDAHVTITSSSDHAGRLQHFIGVSTDVTEHKRAENALREAEEKYRTFANFTYDLGGLGNPGRKLSLHVSVLRAGDRIHR